MRNAAPARQRPKAKAEQPASEFSLLSAMEFLTERGVDYSDCRNSYEVFSLASDVSNHEVSYCACEIL